LRRKCEKEYVDRQSKQTLKQNITKYVPGGGEGERSDPRGRARHEHPVHVGHLSLISMAACASLLACAEEDSRAYLEVPPGIGGQVVEEYARSSG
jgi:hypothetical protein